MKKLQYKTVLMIFSIFLWGQPLSVQGQSPDIMWLKIFGGRYSDEGCSVCQTGEGGYIVAGHTYISATRGFDAYLVKINSTGGIVWERTYGGLDYDWANSVAKTTDGGYIIAGGTSSFGIGNSDVYLVKTDSSGEILWERTYGGELYEDALEIQPTSDGGYIIVGWTNSFGAGHDDVYLIKTDVSGDTLWTRTFGGNYYDKGYSVKQTADGNYIVTGGIDYWSPTNPDVYLVKIDPNGDSLWTSVIDGGWSEAGRFVVETYDGGYMLIGWTMSFGHGAQDVYLVKVESTGEMVFSKTYGGAQMDIGTSIRTTLDGGYIISGYTKSFGAGSDDVYVIKIDYNGDTLWTKTIGGIEADQGQSAISSDDGGYVIVGWTRSFGGSGSNVILIKLDSDQATDTGDKIDFITPGYTKLGQNYPNPFNAITTISFSINTSQHVGLKIYNLLGHEVLNLIDEIRQTGVHQAAFDASNLSSGVYIYKLQTADYTETKRMVLLK